MIPRSKALVFLVMALMFVLVMPNASSQKHKDEELDKKTLALLNDIASAAWGLKLPENRLFVMSSTADLLWTSDEKRARNLYWEALNTLNLIAPAVRSTGENSLRAEREKTEAYLTIFNLRRNLLLQVAQKDFQFALDMLRATRQVAPRPFIKGLPLPDDRQLEQEIASEVAVRDPAQALQVARESLAKGLSYELINLVYRLNRKDPEKATQFAGDIIAKLRTSNIATDFRASNIAVRLLETSRIPDADRPTLSVGSFKTLNLNNEQKRELVDLLTTAALGVSANSHLLYDIFDLMPEIQEFFPERRVPLERKLARFNDTLTKPQRDQLAYNELVRGGRAEEMIRRASLTDDETRRMLYQQAAIAAAFRETTDSFRELVSKEVKDEGEQRKILDALDEEEINVAVGRKKIDYLKKLLSQIRRKEQRARAMAELAVMLKEKGEDAEAESLLDEAATLIKTDLKSETQTNALLSLLCAYAVVDPPKAFALAERTVDQANDQISMLMLIDKVVKSGAVKKNEIVLDQPGIMPLSFLVFRYGKGVAALARADFNRTRSLADRFERNELRVMARLLIVKGILTPERAENPM